MNTRIPVENYISRAEILRRIQECELRGFDLAVAELWRAYSRSS